MWTRLSCGELHQQDTSPADARYLISFAAGSVSARSVQHYAGCPVSPFLPWSVRRPPLRRPVGTCHRRRCPQLPTRPRCRSPRAAVPRPHYAPAGPPCIAPHAVAPHAAAPHAAAPVPVVPVEPPTGDDGAAAATAAVSADSAARVADAAAAAAADAPPPAPAPAAPAAVAAAAQGRL